MRIRAAFTVDVDDNAPEVFETDDYLREVLVENVRDVLLGMDFNNVKFRSFSVDREE